MICWLLLLSFYASIANGKHFDGGTISWRPVDSKINSSIVPIIISQSYIWTASIIICSTNVPISTPVKSGENANLICVGNCSADGGYSNKPINILTDCQSVNSLSNILTSQRTVTVNLTADANFSISYTSLPGQNWISLNNPPNGNLCWSLACSIDIRRRPDGFINTAPVASVMPPQYVPVNETILITIPVWDVNAGDDVRCRWAVNTIGISPSGIDECNGICYPGSVPIGTTLFKSNCTVSFFGPIPGIYYGIAIQVEDFIDSTSLTAMSSVPVQFLIYVLNQSACDLAPVVLPLDLCFDVQVGVLISFNMSAMTLCNPNVSSIASISITTGIPGMNASNLSNSSTNQSVSYVTLTWTPSASQLGSQQLCVLAYTDENLPSSQYCVTFNVISSPPVCFTTITSTTSTTTSETTTVITTAPASTVAATIEIINSVVESNTSKQRAMWLAFCLPALLLTLCCSCFSLYFWYWGLDETRRRLRKRTVIYKKWNLFG